MMHGQTQIKFNILLCFSSYPFRL